MARKPEKIVKQQYDNLSENEKTAMFAVMNDISKEKMKKGGYIGDIEQNQVIYVVREFLKHFKMQQIKF